MVQDSLDYLVLGGGQMGVLTAREIKKVRPDARMALMEQGEIGEGVTHEFQSGTRDPGKLGLIAPDPGFEDSVTNIGRHATNLYVQSNLDGKAILYKLANELGQPDLVMPIEVITTGKTIQAGWLNFDLSYLRQLAQQRPKDLMSALSDVRFADKEEIANTFGTDPKRYDRGLVLPQSTLINAPRLTQLAWSQLLSQYPGTASQIHQKAEKIEPLQNGTYRVYTSDGQFEAKNVIVAANAAIGTLVPGLNEHINAKATYITYWDRPKGTSFPFSSEAQPMTAGWNNRKNYCWWVIGDNDQMLVGGGDSRRRGRSFVPSDFDMRHGIDYVVNFVYDKWPQMKGKEPLHQDYGWFAATERGVPFIEKVAGEQPDFGVWAVGGCNGSGQYANAIMAQILTGVVGLRSLTPRENQYAKLVYTLALEDRGGIMLPPAPIKLTDRRHSELMPSPAVSDAAQAAA